MQFTPREELAHRLQRIQSAMTSAGLDGMLLMQKADLFYVTGTVQNGVAFVPRMGEPVLAVKRSLGRAQRESAWEGVVGLRSMRDLPGLLAERGHKGFFRLGLEMDVLPARNYLQFRDLFLDAELEDVSPLLRRVRAVKSGYEIERIERAAEQLRVVMAEIPAMIRDGCEREIDLAAKIEGALRHNRHQGIVRTRRFGLEMYYGAVSTGASASFPTDFDGPDGMEGLYPAVPQNGGERPLRSGEPIMVDLCGGHDGYIADKTRIFVPGGLADKELLRAHDFALRVQGEVAGLMRPGAVASDIWHAVEEIVKDSDFADTFMGYGDNQSRFVGHGVGLELDELPILTGRSDITLEEGMVIAVEPKFFFGDRGGVGIENTWVITGDGCRNLTADDDAIVTV